MKVILVMVQTVNGKTTRGSDSDIYKWTSKEDADFFFSLLKKHKLIVMGSGTYEAARDKIKPVEGQLRVILTRNPEKYKEDEVRGQLEFRDQKPRELVEDYSIKGFANMLLVSGETLNALFLQEKCIDELYVTLEPRIFGEGRSLFKSGNFESSLTLLSSRRLNEKGTLLLRYHVEK